MSHFKRFLVLSALAVSLSIFAMSGAFAADGFSDAQKADIGQIVKDYLKDNPDVVYTALISYQQKKQDEMSKEAESHLSESQEALTGKDLPSAGNPKGDVTVTEFFDYNCGYCKHAIDDVQKLLDSDKNVRVVFKELPILGPTSEVAARWSEAANKQGKYFAFHSRLLHNTGQIDEATLEKVATDAGLDVAQLKKDADTDEVKSAVGKSRELAQTLQINGTPCFIINGKFYRGYLGPDGLKKAVDDARAEKK